MSSAILKSFSWCGPAIQKLCEADSEFAKHLINQTQEQRQCLAFVVLGWDRMGSKELHPRELGKKLRCQSKKALLKQFIRPYPAGLVSVLKKLGNRIMIKVRYLELIDLLVEPNAAKFLWHQPKIQSGMISALVGLDPEFRLASIVRNVTNQSTLHSIQYAIAVARKASPETSDSVLAKSLEEALSHNRHQMWLPIETAMVLQEWLSHRLTMSGHRRYQLQPRNTSVW